MKLYASAIALKDCSVPRIRGDDPVPGKRTKAATRLSPFDKMVPIVLGATGILRLAELSRPNQRRRND